MQNKPKSSGAVTFGAKLVSRSWKSCRQTICLAHVHGHTDMLTSDVTLLGALRITGDVILNEDLVGPDEADEENCVPSASGKWSENLIYCNNNCVQCD